MILLKMIPTSKVPLYQNFWLRQFSVNEVKLYWLIWASLTILNQKHVFSIRATLKLLRNYHRTLQGIYSKNVVNGDKNIVDLFQTNSVPLDFPHCKTFFDFFWLNQNLESAYKAIKDGFKLFPRIASQNFSQNIPIPYGPAY